jgi:hypothetical protein
MLLIGPQLDTMGGKLDWSCAYAVRYHISYAEYPFYDWLQLVAHIHVFPITNSGATYLLCETIFVHFGLLFRSPRVGHLYVIILTFPGIDLLLCRLPLISDEQVVSLRYQFIPLIPILKFLIFKDGSSGELAGPHIKTYKLAFGGYLIIDVYGSKELPIRRRVVSMNSGKALEHPMREHTGDPTGGSYQRSVTCSLCVFRIPKQRIGIPYAIGKISDILIRDNAIENGTHA